MSGNGFPGYWNVGGQSLMTRMSWDGLPVLLVTPSRSRKMWMVKTSGDYVSHPRIDEHG